ncbi:hypothetical protein [Acrocarpospora sp. B8E8]|uniref:hypothetical protein n=1 Tax=Acrocarpospora sp. B8E8 TaxID=3153572 RepID=UPI00325EA67A
MAWRESDSLQATCVLGHAAWIRWRLAAWFDVDGRLREGLQLPSLAAAARAEQVRAEQARVRTADQQARADRVDADQDGRAERARAELQAARQRAAQAHAPQFDHRHDPEAARERAALLAADTTQSSTGQRDRLAEPQEVFRREVIDRHALSVFRYTSEPANPGPKSGPEPGADELAAQRAWLVAAQAARQCAERTRLRWAHSGEPREFRP